MIMLTGLRNLLHIKRNHVTIGSDVETWAILRLTTRVVKIPQKNDSFIEPHEDVFVGVLPTTAA